MFENKQKQYFKKKLQGVQNMIWDLEFKRFKTKEIREEIRQEYDDLRAKLNILDAQILSEKNKPTMEKGEIARLDDKKVLIKRDIERLEGQMKGLDLEIEGSKPCEEYKDGVQGVNDQLDALRELVGMLEAYIRML